MLKVQVSASKKVPGAEAYSSDHYHCGLELEVADSLLGTVDLARHIDHLYRIVNEAVDVQIQRNRQGMHAHPAPLPRHGTVPGTGMANGLANGIGKTQATLKQVRFIEQLAIRKLGLTLTDIEALCQSVGSTSFASINRDQASKVIEQLNVRSGNKTPAK